MSTLKMSDGTEVIVDDLNEIPVDYVDERNYEAVRVVVPDGETITFLTVEVDSESTACRLDLDDIDALIASLQRARRQATRNGAQYRDEASATD